MESIDSTHFHIAHLLHGIHVEFKRLILFLLWEFKHSMSRLSHRRLCWMLKPQQIIEKKTTMSHFMSFNDRFVAFYLNVWGNEKRFERLEEASIDTQIHPFPKSLVRCLKVVHVYFSIRQTTADRQSLPILFYIFNPLLVIEIEPQFHKKWKFYS